MLVPNPSYPIHAFGFLMAGGVIRSVPSEPTPSFFAALERAIMHSIPKPIAVVVCYPSNPTAYVADLDFYKDLVPFAKKHGIFVLSDLAYAEVYFDDNPPPSVLQVPGAMDVAVEFTSMSKTFSMPGWRIGFAVGNERIIAALARVKSYLDYGAFTPIQVAATAALNGPDDCIREMRETYKQPPRRAGGKLRPRRLDDSGAARLDVRLGADPGAVPHARAASNSPSFWSKRPRSRSRPASASASTAKAMCASRWSRTSSASARPPATSAASLKQGRKSCTTWFPWRRGARRMLPEVATGFRIRSCANDKAVRHSPSDALMAAPLKVGIAGLGTVGAAVVRLIERERDALVARCGRPIEVGRGERALARQEARRSICERLRWVADPVELAGDPGIDVLVELIGGAGRSGASAAVADRACRPASRS